MSLRARIKPEVSDLCIIVGLASLLAGIYLFAGLAVMLIVGGLLIGIYGALRDISRR